MAAGCPLVISDVRGHRDVCINTRNGFLFDLKKPQEFINSIKKLYSDRNLYEKISKNNIEDIHKFTIEREVGEMARIYKLYSHNIKVVPRKDHDGNADHRRPNQSKREPCSSQETQAS